MAGPFNWVLVILTVTPLLVPGGDKTGSKVNEILFSIKEVLIFGSSY